jgi:hypothetical protein
MQNAMTVAHELSKAYWFGLGGCVGVLIYLAIQIYEQRR